MWTFVELELDEIAGEDAQTKALNLVKEKFEAYDPDDKPYEYYTIPMRSLKKDPKRNYLDIQMSCDRNFRYVGLMNKMSSTYIAYDLAVAGSEMKLMPIPQDFTATHSRNN